MPRKTPKSRIYTREQGGALRYYGDFRAFSDIGGTQEALVAPGEKMATTDPLVAERLAGDRLADLIRQRQNRALGAVQKQRAFAEFASYHLVQKAKSGRVTEGWLSETQRKLEAARDFFGADRDLASIQASDVERFAHALASQPGGRGGKTLSGGTVRHYLNALSNLYRRAQSDGAVPPGFNPVAALIEKPTAQRQEARWLEVHEAALLLESARTYRPKRDDIALPHLYPLLATFLLTGGRQSEVLGLEVDDVSFDRKTVTFRPNRWRRLKTQSSHRTVPLWPQLEEILRAYVFGGSRPLGALLFPSPRAAGEAMLTDIRTALEGPRLAESGKGKRPGVRSVASGVAVRAGWKPGEIRTKMFRHTYCATRLQTLDRGYPVSEFTVAREMGHGGTELVRRVYGHLGSFRHRSEFVEYRVEQHADLLDERIRALR